MEDAIEGEKFRNELQAIADQNGQNRGTEEVSCKTEFEGGYLVAYI